MKSTPRAPTVTRLADVHEAAAALGVAAKTIRQMAHDGRLPSIRLAPNGRLRFRVSDLERFIENGGC